jgi:cytochrome c551/c552
VVSLSDVDMVSPSLLKLAKMYGSSHDLTSEKLAKNGAQVAGESFWSLVGFLGGLVEKVCLQPT